ncbi:MAG TPA: right-handed parallel beta-helix repeat-containing protein, partial [Candidatus Saccharimonadales bacterium]|nr:right-handed parallel beta-helix repeat-containing protein [Candidatus Saccharimonadales bacterium]
MAPLLGLSVFLAVFVAAAPAVQAATTSSTLNFQARLLNNLGGIVPDGTYNIDFKLYTADSTTGTVGTCTGSCVWEETRTGASKVQVIDGYFSVNLGSVTPFGSTINWDQQLWLTMNIGGTGGTPSWDGEMQNAGHSIALTALPYSFTAGKLAKTSGANRGTLAFNTVANNPVITLPDETGTVCTTAASGICTQAGTGFVQLQNATPGTAQTGSFNINGTGIAVTLQAGTMDTATATALGIGTTHATEIDLNQSTVIAAGKTLKITGDTTANRPAASSGNKGMLYFDTNTGQLLQSNGSKWISAPRSKTFIVAANNSTQAEKDAADAIAPGSGDQATINGFFTSSPCTTTGCSVYLMEGTYTISAAISIPNNSILEGAGTATVITLPASQNGSYNMIQNTDTATGTNVTIRNLVVDGNSSSQSSGSMNGIHLDGVGSGTARMGATIDQVTVRNIYGINNGQIYMLAVANTKIQNSSFKDSSGTDAVGIEVGSSSAANNLIHGNVFNGLRAVIACGSNTTISSNSFQNSRVAAIELCGPENTASGNSISGSTSTGIGVDTYSNNTVTGNTIQSATNTGIWLSGSTNTTVSGNNISSSGAEGIWLTGGASNNSVTGNKVQDSGGATTNYGIYLNNSSDNKNSITGNDITDSGCSTSCYALYISGTSNYLSNNHFLGDGTNAATLNDAGTTTVFSGQTLAESGASIFKASSNSTANFQVQNATNAASVFAVDTNNNQLVLGTPGVGGISGQIKFYFAGSSGSTTLVMADPGANNYTLTIPAGGGTICTTANGLCSGGGGGGTGLAKDAVDTSSADAGTGYLYTFTNTGIAETGGVLSLNNGNNTGPALYLKDTSNKAFQVQNSSGYNALVLDTSGNPAHLKVYDGTATQAYADIYYDDTAGAAVFTASTGSTQVGGASGTTTLVTAGSGQALTLTGHASSSWTLDSGDLTIDVT